MSLLGKLKDYSRGNVYPLHMPGHKRNDSLSNGLPFGIDITEIAGFDDLHNPHGCIADLSSNAASLYGAAYAFPLVNGTTGGILSAIRTAAAAKPASKHIICSKYSHRSVFNAAELCGLIPVLFEPPFDSVSGVTGSVLPREIARLLDEFNCAAVVITSPTYDGVVSDIAAIAETAHDHGTPLITDAAHGAHFGFYENFPQNAIRLGADIEVVSLHKTLPAMTQCSLLLLNSERFAASDIQKQLSVFQTSSPSYVLMASIGNCVDLLSAAKNKLFEDYRAVLDGIYKKLSALKHLRIISRSAAFFDADPGKIRISTAGANISGPELASVLRDDYGFELEYSADNYALAMTSIADTADALTRFADALLVIDAGLKHCAKTAERVLPPGTVNI